MRRVRALHACEAVDTSENDDSAQVLVPDTSPRLAGGVSGRYFYHLSH